MTNAEQIRSMNDTELAEFIFSIEKFDDDFGISLHMKESDELIVLFNDKESVEEWLVEPYKQEV
jgi:hypothetical protein